MERNREVRRASIVGSNGFNRRRHKTNMLRDSPDEDGGVELQQSVRLRDRTKKDRDRERERERERGRERERDLRERSSRSTRRRGERLISNRDDRVDETSDESLNDDDYEEDDDATANRLNPPAAASNYSSLAQQHSTNNTNTVISSNHHLQHRKSFPPASSSKVFRAAPIWKPDEIISVSVPRKARSVSAKRSHDWTSTSSNNNSGGGGEQVHRQASTSPARQGGASTSTPSPAAPMSPPSSSNAPHRKKLKSGGSNGGLKLRPPKAAAKQSSSNPEELEIEIAEVLYGLMTQSQVPSSKKDDSRENYKSNGDVEPQVSSQISNSNSANKQISGTNSSPMQTVGPKRKRPMQIPDNSSYVGSAKLDMDKTAKSEISFPNLDKLSASDASETEGNSVSPPEQLVSASVKVNLKLADTAEGLREFAVKKDMSSPKEKKSTAMRNEDIICMDTTALASASSTMIKANALVSDVGNQRLQKLEIDLMAPPPQVRSSPEREIKIHLKAVVSAADQKASLAIDNTDRKTEVLYSKVDEKRKTGKEQSEDAAVEGRKEKSTVEEAGLKKEIENKVDLEKPIRNGNAAVNSSGNKLQLHNDKQQQQEMPFKANREEPLSEKSSQSKSCLPLAVPMASWPGGLPRMGYMAPLQGVVSMDGSTVAPPPIQPLFSQPRPKRCATHSYIARSIQCLEQVMKMNPFWHTATGSASFLGSKPGNLDLMHANLHAPDKANNLTSNTNHSGRDKGAQTAGTSDSGPRKQPILIQPPVAATNLLGPAFIFPLNQQQATVASSTKSASIGGSTGTSEASASASSSVAAATVSFNYPAMAANETQYLAILQNRAYPFPPIPAVGAPPNCRGNPALFNASFYSPQMIHPSQLHHQQTPSLQQPYSITSSSSQRHLQQSSGVNAASATAKSQDVPGPKSTNPPRSRHFDGSQESPSTTDSSPPVNIYGQNFVMPIHPHNFTLMTPPPPPPTPPTALAGTASATASGSSNQTEKQLGFAMSFGTVNCTNTGGMAQNHAVFQSFPEAARQNFQMTAAQKKHFRGCEEDKSERRSLSAKSEGGGVGQSRSDSAVSCAQANGVNASPNVSRGLGAINLGSNHIEQQQFVKAPGRSLFSEHLNSSCAKYINVQGSTSPCQSPQWRSSTASSQQHRSAQQTSFGGKRPTASSITSASATPPSIPNRSILGQHPHVTSSSSSSSSGAKLPQQKQSQPPMNLQQPQLLFSNPYSQAQSAHLTSTRSTTSSSAGGIYKQQQYRKQADQQQASTGMLTTMNDPAHANVKGGGGTLLPSSFSYPHPAAEQKQPAG